MEETVRISLPSGAQMVRIGSLAAGSGITLSFAGAPMPLPEHLGYEHRS
ncbi:MAG: hypothetical protein ABR588_07850 [Sphingomicrobium sp.]